MLTVIVSVLLTFGLIMMYNINPALSQKLLGRVDAGYYFKGQLINIAAGVISFMIASSIYYKVWRRYALLFLVISVIALLALWVPGLSFSKNGATRWLNLGPVSFQPAELLKLSMVVYLGAWFEKRQAEVKSFWDGVVPFAIMLGIMSVIVVVFQRDMGTMLVVAMSAMGMFYLAGIRLRDLGILVSGAVVAGWMAIVSFPHRLSRLATFLDPSKDASGGGYHVNQALIAIGSGGILGAGLGKSIQIYGYLPEASNDSIFAVIGEEFGLIGALLIIGLFGVLVWRGIKIAQTAPDMFARLVAGGLTLVLFFQAFINIAAMVSLVPLTGIPLPFISYGGSSLVIMMFAVGMLLNISKYTVKEVENANSAERWGNSRPRLAGVGSRRRPQTSR